jgi:hypothetical protein
VIYGIYRESGQPDATISIMDPSQGLVQASFSALVGGRRNMVGANGRNTALWAPTTVPMFQSKISGRSPRTPTVTMSI